MADPQIYDLAISNEALDSDASLKTAVTLSLLTWARAQPGDTLPEATDLKGWWGDSYARVAGDQFGSRIWTLFGQPITQELLARFDELAREALQWLVEDGVVAEFQVELEQIGDHTIGAKVGIKRPRDASLTWLDTWQVSLASV